MSKIVHLGRNGLIMNKFVEFMEENFDNKKHIYFLTGQNVNGNKNVIDIKNKFDFIKKIFYLNFQLYKTKKIIIHSFDQTYMFFILLFQPWLIKKVYWVIWGWDLYSYEYPVLDLKTKIIQKVKKIIFPKIRHFVTYIEGDYELAKKWYNIKSINYYECIMYPSNFYKDNYNIIQIDDKKDLHKDTLNIQIGNSASESNNHLYIFQKLKYFADENIKIFIPLSYGKNDNLNEIIKQGKNIFCDKITFLNDILSFDEYIKFQSSIDIAVFAHKQQEAMGNIISLLGLGKKVYIRNDITPFKFFNDMGVKVFDVENIELELLEQEIKKMNQQKIREYFSKENYLNQLKNIFESK